MKKEETVLKSSIKEYYALCDVFNKKRELFNLKVEDLLEDYNYRLQFLGLSEKQINELDYYDQAKHFFHKYADVIKVFNSMRNNQESFDYKKMVSSCVRYLMRTYDIDYTTAYFVSCNYSLFVEAGFYKALKCESASEKKLNVISEQMKDLTDSARKDAEVIFNNLKERIKPITDKARPMVNKGSKTLVKVFDYISSKTEKKDE